MNITKTRQLSSFLLTPLSLGLPNKPRQYSTYVVITGGWLIFMEKVNGCDTRENTNVSIKINIMLCKR